MNLVSSCTFRMVYLQHPCSSPNEAVLQGLNAARKEINVKKSLIRRILVDNVIEL